MRIAGLEVGQLAVLAEEVAALADRADHIDSDGRRSPVV
jgi:hypothetical protein